MITVQFGGTGKGNEGKLEGQLVPDIKIDELDEQPVDTQPEPPDTIQ